MQIAALAAFVALFLAFVVLPRRLINRNEED